MRKKLPIGIENFGEFSSDDFYYVDKTGLIVDLLHNWGKVNLFTRPRRFGKSLNMSMLQHYFEIGCDKRLFEGLRISREKELCESYMGRYPVIALTLKGVDGLNFEAACAAMRSTIGRELLRFEFLLESDRLSDREKQIYEQMAGPADGKQEVFSMPDALLADSLQNLSMLLFKHYGSRVIILIDEYDVPLDKAFQAGYYDEMVSLMRNLFGNALKTNEYLQFAVLMGCLRISKESIFTGLNNMNVMSVTDEYFDEYFGFTDADVQELLAYYGLEYAFDTIKEWYDGYRFGNASIYCPWDVIKYCQALLKNKNAVPENYWANTSGNVMVCRFIEKASQQTRNEIEKLIEGESITKAVNMELTYNELDTTIYNLWSVLFTTGYLTQLGREEDRRYRLSIPNREIRELFISQIREWFQESTGADTGRIAKFCGAFPDGDVRLIEDMLNEYLWNTISIRDSAARSGMKENFYHGMLLGLLRHEESWLLKSNTESGEGFSDILIETRNGTGIIIEVKYAEDGKLDRWCRAALEQIKQKHYAARLLEDGMERIICYGISFYRKRCRAALHRPPVSDN
ncbi:MAG: AAA family ATPase [Lachnospiraceae bacterium]|nr:AAA family ATPase [Lachnospiraceae bacterium]